MHLTIPSSEELEDGLHKLTYGGTTVVFDPTDPYKSTLEGNCPLLMGAAAGSELLLVEGWQAAVAISGAADERYTVVCFSHTEQLARTERVLPESYTPTAVTVVLARPGDIMDNRANWSLARAARSSLGKLSGIEALAVGGTLDPWPVWLVDRPGALATHLSKRGRPKVAPPAAEKTRGALLPTIDWDGGRILLKVGDQEDVFMTAAVRVLASYRITDDMNMLDSDGNSTQHELRYDLRVAVGQGHGRREASVTHVRDEDLDTPRRWLKRLPHGLGTSVVVAPGLSASAHVANAIRLSAAEAPSYEYYNRTGWLEWEGRWVYLHAGGAIGASGETRVTKTVFTKSTEYNPISFPEVSDAAAALAHSWDLWNLVSNKAAMWALLGTALHSVAGLGIGAVPWVYGRKGTGKTILASIMNAHYSRKWVHLPMTKMDRSVAAAARIGVGLHHGFALVDDFRRQTNVRSMEAMMTAAEQLIRRGFEAGAAHVAMVQDSRTGQWISPPPEQTTPAIAILGEILPGASAVAPSTLERLLPVEVTKHHLIEKDDFAAVIHKADSTLPAQALATFIRWVAAGIEVRGMDAWQEKWRAKRDEVAKQLEEALGRDHARSARVGSLALTGAHLWLEVLLEHGVIDHDEHAAATATAFSGIREALAVHADVNLDEDGPERAIIHALRAAVAQGRVLELKGQIPSEWKYRPTPIMVQHTTVAGVGAAVAILPDLAIQVLGRRDLNATELARELGAVAIKHGDRPMRQVRWTASDSRVRCVVLPLSEWTRDSETSSVGDGQQVVGPVCADAPHGEEGQVQGWSGASSAPAGAQEGTSARDKEAPEGSSDDDDDDANRVF